MSGALQYETPRRVRLGKPLDIHARRTLDGREYVPPGNLVD
jgi:hypothetical protein